MEVHTSLLIATSNKGKLEEVRHLLSDLPLRILSLRDFPEINEIEETGSSFAENAALKATGYALQTAELTLADDSGLKVDALGGAPGVLSARYAGKGASDLERIEKLLAELEMVDKASRKARFVAAVAVANRQGRVLNVSIGKCEGIITFSPRGQAGFGYDPIFMPEGYDETFAELGSEIKSQISHRAHALRQARDHLMGLTRHLSDG